MIVWTVLNIILRFVLTVCMVVGVIKYAEQLNWLERAGMGFVGGASIMTIPMIIDVYNRGTPFDGWATSILTAGCIMIVAGIMVRMRRHQKRNAEQINAAKAHLKGRGKL
jgi:hypothetical protein